MSAPFLAAGWFEIIAALLFFLITGIAQYLQKRAQERRALRAPPGVGDRGPASGSPTALPPVVGHEGPPARDDWEAQLRRLLEGEPEPAHSPPVLSSPAPAPPPIPEPYAYEETRSLESATTTPREELAVKVARQKTAIGPARAADAYREAADLSGRAGSLMEQARSLRTPRITRPSRYATHRAPAGSVLATFRDPADLRQAVIASTVLSAPKALE